MRQVLVVHFSQTGQLERLADSVCAPLLGQPGIQVDFLPLVPVKPYPFPWPFLTFFSVFPETVLMQPEALQPLSVDPAKRYDLIILAYQVWFLSPSRPISSFLATSEARALLRDTPVMTLIGCRNMWLMAQEKMKVRLSAMGATLLDNVALTDECGTAASFLATPLWMFSGKRKALSWVPQAGISDADIAAAERFGVALRARLTLDNTRLEAPILTGLGAVRVDEKLIASEKVGSRSFQLWGRLIAGLSPQQSLRRRLLVAFYVVFLISLILTVVPLTALLKKLLGPLFRAKTQRDKAYFAAPSGE